MARARFDPTASYRHEKISALDHSAKQSSCNCILLLCTYNKMFYNTLQKYEKFLKKAFNRPSILVITLQSTQKNYATVIGMTKKVHQSFWL